MTSTPATVAMVTVVLGALVRDRRVLLGLRSPTKQANPGVWDLPGGVVEPGESEEQALTRELREELGIRIEVATASLLRRVVASPAGEPVQMSAWLVEDWQGTPVNRAPDEHQAIAWFDIEAMPRLAHPELHTALEAAVLRGGSAGFGV